MSSRPLALTTLALLLAAGCPAPGDPVDDDDSAAQDDDDSTDPAWSPAELPGLVLWIDWADPDVSFSDDGCSVLAAAGDEVRCVLDKSEHGATLVPLDPRPGPAIAATRFGSIRHAEFSDPTGGDADAVLWTAHSDALDITTAGMTVVLVDAPDVVDGDAASGYHTPLCKEKQYEIAWQNGALGAAVNTEAAGPWQWGVPEPADWVPGAQLNVFEHDDDEWRFRRGGALVASMPPSAGQVGAIETSEWDGAPSPVTVGGRLLGLVPPLGNNGPPQYQAGQGELLLFDVVLSDDDLTTLENHLLQKWSL